MAPVKWLAWLAGLAGWLGWLARLAGLAGKTILGTDWRKGGRGVPFRHRSWKQGGVQVLGSGYRFWVQGLCAGAGYRCWVVSAGTALHI